MERLQKLVNTSYEKISELELLLIEEYKMTGDVNLSTQLSSILLRQKKIVDRALRSIGQNVKQQQQQNSISQPQPQPSTSSSHSHQPFNNKTGTSTNSLGRSSKNKGARFDRRGSGPLESNSKLDDSSDIRSSKSNSTLVKSTYDHNHDQPDLKQQSRSGSGSKGNESSWYGSLDRNLVKRKKGRNRAGGAAGSELDKSRRHRKTVASLATLEQTGDEELQPDEQYEIGLPPLSSSASCNFSRVSLDPKQNIQRRAPIPIPDVDVWTLPYSLSRATMQQQQQQQQRPCPPPPPLPPAIAIGARAAMNTSSRMSHLHLNNSHSSISTPSLSSNSNSNLRVNYHGNQGHSHSHNISNASASASFENTGTGAGAGVAIPLRSPKSKAWFETNLDDSAAHPPRLLSPVTVDCSNSNRSTPTDHVDSSTNFLNVKQPMLLPILSPKTDISEKSMSSRSSESSLSTRLNFLNESTKPFEMSDVYKYSSRYKDPSDPNSKPMPKESRRSTTFDHNGNPNPSMANPGSDFSRGTPTGRNTFKNETDPSGSTEDHLYQNLAQIQNAQQGQGLLEDELDLGWVMDTPTFV